MSQLSKYHRTALFSSFIAAFGVQVGSVLGQSADVPTPAALIEALQAKGSTRGAASVTNSELIKTLKTKTSRGLAISPEEREQLFAVAKTMPAYDMEIPFDLDSFEITERARPAIKALGQALQDVRLKGSSFVVAGHTDVTGSSAHNQRLSEQRASAVRQVLVSDYNLSADLLIPVGYGPHKLKDTKNPASGENRRVQIVNLGE